MRSLRIFSLIATTVLFAALLLGGCTSPAEPIVVDAEQAAVPEETPFIPEETSSEQPESTPAAVEGSAQAALDQLDSSKSPFEKGYYDYRGVINDTLPVQMSLYPSGGELVGSYIYDSERKEVTLKGKADDKNIVLLEYDEAGKNTGVFNGTLSAVDQIEGTWVSADGQHSFPFAVSLASSLPGAEYGKRYAVALGAADDQDVESFVAEVQGYLASDEKEQLAEAINYPINIKMDGKAAKLQSKDDFIKNYDKIFHPDLKKAVGNAYAKYLFANAKGIMAGEGSYNIWINEISPAGGSPKLMISAINN